MCGQQDYTSYDIGALNNVINNNHSPSLPIWQLLAPQIQLDDIVRCINCYIIILLLMSGVLKFLYYSTPIEWV